MNTLAIATLIASGAANLVLAAIINPDDNFRSKAIGRFLPMFTGAASVGVAFAMMMQP